MDGLDLDVLLFDCDEIVRIRRRDAAYWTLWAVRGPRLKKLPEAIEDLTGERVHRDSEWQEPTDEQLDRIRGLADQHKAFFAARRAEPGRRAGRSAGQDRAARDTLFQPIFRRLHEEMTRGESGPA